MLISSTGNSLSASTGYSLPVVITHQTMITADMLEFDTGGNTINRIQESIFALSVSILTLSVYPELSVSLKRNHSI